MSKILVADDDQGIVEALKMLLEDEGYEVATNFHGQQTVRDAQDLQPDLVLLDIWMSGVNGRDICLGLREQTQTAKTPIIMMSANPDTASIASEAGADDYILKPFDVDDVLVKIERCLAARA